MSLDGTWKKWVSLQEEIYGDLGMVVSFLHLWLVGYGLEFIHLLSLYVSLNHLRTGAKAYFITR